jgi:hypothetical protein
MRFADRVTRVSHRGRGDLHRLDFFARVVELHVAGGSERRHDGFAWVEDDHAPAATSPSKRSIPRSRPCSNGRPMVVRTRRCSPRPADGCAHEALLAAACRHSADAGADAEVVARLVADGLLWE